MPSIRDVNTKGYLGTPNAEAQTGKLQEPSTGGYTVIEPDLAFDLQVKREMEDERAARRPKFDPKVRNYAKGGKVSSKASSRADGCAQRGKTKGRMV